MSITGLLHKRKRLAVGVIVERGKVERAVEIRPVRRAESAECWDIDTCLQKMTAARQGKGVGELKAVVRPASVHLRSAARKRIRHDDLWNAGKRASRS